MILWITIVAFVGLIILVWGADLQFSSQDVGTIGTVNGQEIPYQLYQRVYYDNLRTLRESNERELTFEDEKRISDQAWDLLVNEILITQEAERLGLPVTDDEVVFWVKSNPPVEARQSPTFQDEQGNFDQQKYLASLQANPQDWVWYEERVRSQLPADKLRQIVLSSAKVSNAEVEDYLATLVNRRVVSYARVDPSDFDISDDEITDAELESYYQEHIDEFMTGERARLRYVRVDKEPSAEDEAEILEEMRGYLTDIRRDLDLSPEKGKETFGALAASFSEGPQAEAGGDRGTLLERGQIRPVELADVVFETPVGKVSEPLKVGQRYYLVMVTSEEDATRRFSTIERAVTPGPDQLTSLRQVVRDLARRAVSEGISAAAQAAGREAKETEPFTQSGFLPELLGFRGAVEFAFQNEPGAIGGPDESANAWVIYEVLARLPADPFPFEQAKAGVKRRLTEERQRAQAKVKADELAELVQEKGIAGGAKSASIEVQQSSRFARTGPIPEIGADIDLAAAAFELELEAVSDLIETETGFYVVRVDSLITPAAEELEQQRQNLRLALEQSRQLQTFQSWLDDLRARAEIVDNRQQLF
jgi:peptidylprolyl isomerase/peptidyl-prolyl cis-trans isomerase D